MIPETTLHSRKGFTLIELLISFMLIGIVVVIITSALRLGAHAVDSGDKKIDSLERIRTSLNIINSQIQSQIPLTFEENGENKYYFNGENKSMQFSSNYSIWGGQKGYVVVRYKVETDNNGRENLIVSENIIGISNIKETCLFNGIDSIYFEYFSKDPAEEYGNWVEKWTDNLMIPEKIKLHFVYSSNDFSMIIPTRTEGSSIRIFTPSGEESSGRSKKSKGAF